MLFCSLFFFFCFVFLRFAKYKCCCCCRGLWVSVISFSFKKAGSLCPILKEIRKEAMNYLSLAFSEFEQLCHFGVISLRNYLILLDRGSGLVPAGSWWHYQFNKNGATLTAICCFSNYDKSKMLAVKTKKIHLIADIWMRMRMNASAPPPWSDILRLKIHEKLLNGIATGKI